MISSKQQPKKKSFQNPDWFLQLSIKISLTYSLKRRLISSKQQPKKNHFKTWIDSSNSQEKSASLLLWNVDWFPLNSRLKNNPFKTRTDSSYSLEKISLTRSFCFVPSCNVHPHSPWCNCTFSSLLNHVSSSLLSVEKSFFLFSVLVLFLFRPPFFFFEHNLTSYPHTRCTRSFHLPKPSLLNLLPIIILLTPPATFIMLIFFPWSSFPIIIRFNNLFSNMKYVKSRATKQKIKNKK